MSGKMFAQCIVDIRSPTKLAPTKREIEKALEAAGYEAKVVAWKQLIDLSPEGRKL